MHGHMYVKSVVCFQCMSVGVGMCAVIGAAYRLGCVHGVIDYNVIIPLWTKSAKKVTKITGVNNGCS